MWLPQSGGEDSAQRSSSLAVSGEGRRQCGDRQRRGEEGGRDLGSVRLRPEGPWERMGKGQSVTGQAGGGWGRGEGGVFVAVARGHWHGRH